MTAGPGSHGLRANLRFLVSVVRPYRRAVLGVIGLSFIGAAFDGISIGLLVPVLVSLQSIEATAELPAAFAWIVNKLSQLPEDRRVLIAMAAVLLAIVLKNAFSLLAIRVGHWLSTRLVADLRTRVMSLLMNVSIAFHREAKAGDLIEKTVHNTEAVEDCLRQIIATAVSGLTFAVLASLLFVLSWPLALVAVAVGAGLLLITSAFTRNVSALGARFATTSRELLTAVHEATAGIQLIKTYSKEQQVLPKLKRAVEADRDALYRLHFKVFAVGPITDALASIGIGVLFVVALLTYEGNTALMLAQLLPFMYVLLRLAPLTRTLQGQAAAIGGAWPFVTIVRELIEEGDKPFVQSGTVAFPGLRDSIAFEGISFGYSGEGEVVLDSVAVSIPAGRTTALVGDSGAGKSTVIALLLRLYDPEQGRILIDGVPLTELDLSTFHANVGVVSQDTFLFSDTVGANIAFGAVGEPTQEAIREAARKAGAEEFIDQLPDGYDTFVGDRGVKLSGGQRQRLSLARAILRDPTLLILDEATSALDVELERRVYDAIADLSANRTVIVVAHRKSSFEDADHVIVLDRGRVVEAGDANDLMRQKGRFYDLVASQ